MSQLHYHIHRSIQEIVLKLQENIDIEDTFEMIIRRANVLKDSVNCIDTLSFDPRKKLNVGITFSQAMIHICVNLF